MEEKQGPAIGPIISTTRKVEVGGIAFLRGDDVDQAGMTAVVTDLPRDSPRFPGSIYLPIVVVDPTSKNNGKAYIYRAGKRAQQSINMATTGDETLLDPGQYVGVQLRLTKAPMKVEGVARVGIAPAFLGKVKVTMEMKSKTDEILAGPPEAEE